MLLLVVFLGSFAIDEYAVSGLVRKHLSENQELFQLRVLKDNYIYILSWEGKALVVDPGEGTEVLALLEKKALILETILITHYHSDHTGGNKFLKKKTDCKIIGPEDKRIPELDRSVDDGEKLIFGPFSIEVLSTPGHTKPHVVYFFRGLHLLFSGDLLFSGGYTCHPQHKTEESALPALPAERRRVKL